MDNSELTIKFHNVQNKINTAKAKGENPVPFMREKMELLQIGYKKLSESLQDDKYEKNPKKYSTLLSYLNNIKNLQTELKLPSESTNSEIVKIHEKMNSIGLGWLIQNQPAKVVKHR